MSNRISNVVAIALVVGAIATTGYAQQPQQAPAPPAVQQPGSMPSDQMRMMGDQMRKMGDQMRTGRITPSR